MLKALILFLIALSIASCELNAYSAKNVMEVEPISDANQALKWRKGEVRYLDFEGGFYGVFAQNGDKLLAVNLPREYMQDGAVIEFQGKEIKDMMTTKQWGTVFEISASRLIKPGTGSHQPTH